MVLALRKQYLPNAVVLVKAPCQAGLGFEMLEGKATAYVCVNRTCLSPTNKVEKMLQQLNTST
jgi:uncharacterized protein YyaL (SSP411 family)